MTTRWSVRGRTGWNSVVTACFRAAPIPRPDFCNKRGAPPAKRPTSRLRLHALLLLSALLPHPAQPQGIPLWTNRTGGAPPSLPVAIATDTNGNAFVAGWSGSSTYNFKTVAYSAGGACLWTNLYFPGSPDSAQASAIAVDSARSRVFVTGHDFLSISPTMLRNCDTVCYSLVGTQLWVNRYQGFGSAGYAVAVGPSGSAVVAGATMATNGFNDFLTISYSSAGVGLWTNRYNGPANGNDVAGAVAVDSSGNVFVTGYSTNGAGGNDYATVSYSSGGVLRWSGRYNSPASGDARPRGIALDPSGNVYVTGYSWDSNTSNDFATVAYSGAGVPLWTNRYGGPTNTDERAVGIAVDRASSNVFVTGYSVGVHYDYATVAYSQAGVPLWTNRYDGPAAGDDKAAGIAVDATGNVFVTGNSGTNSSYGNYYATIAYTGAGVPLWTNRFNWQSNLNDYATAIAVSPGGNVLVTGYSWTNSYFDFATIKYSSSIPAWLNIQPASNKVVLDWTNAGCELQSASALDGPFATLTNATSPFTTPAASPRQYFRLLAK